ncbi:MAG: 2-deoxy-5-keto-D-gluconate 6-phosphate aldolase domain-containing protein [Solirubrobacterales bacterium]
MSAPPARQRLLMLAFDHRTSFAREVIGTDEEPDAREAARVREAKLAVFEGLAAVAGPGGIPAADLGVLVDEQYGSAIPPLARERGLTVAVAVERSGRRVFEFEYGERFEQHIEAIDPDLAKVLVRLNPDGDAAANEIQLERLRRLGDSLREHRRGFLFELLVPPTDAQLEAAGGDPARYQDEARPELIVRAMESVQRAGIEPDLWKLEGVERAEEAAAIVAQARNEPGRSEVGCVVLGAGAGDERVERWLRVSAATEGYRGFAIGRSIWRDPLLAFLDDGDREAVVERVRERFLRFAGVWLEAEAPQVAPGPAANGDSR